MATTLKSAKFQIKYLGDLVNGKQAYINKTYAKLVTTAADQDIFDVANAIALLQSKVLGSIVKSTDSEITSA